MIVVLAFVGGIHQLHLEAGLFPRLFDRSGRNTRVECHGYFTNPVRTPIGTEIKPRKIATATTHAVLFKIGVCRGWFSKRAQ